MTAIEVHPQEIIPAENRERSALPVRLALLLILLIAASLRFYHLGRHSLWFDEGLTARLLRAPLPDMLHAITTYEQTPPLFYFLLRPVVALLGDSESILRLPSAIYGTLSVLALYLATQRAFNTAAALTSALLLALSPYHVAYSQEARAYALFVLLTILSSDLLMRAFQRRRGWIDALYILTSTALLYTHLYGIFVLAAHHVAWLVSTAAHRKAPRPLDLPRWFTLNFAIAILYAPFLPTVRDWLGIVQHGFWVKRVTWNDIAAAYETYAGSAPLLIALLALIVIALVLRPRSRPQTASQLHKVDATIQSNVPARSLWLLILLLPVVIPVTISVLTRPTFSARYAMPASLGLYVLAGAGLSQISRLNLQIPAATILATLTLFPSTLPDPKPQWRQAAHYLELHMRPGDLAAINRKGAICLWDYYIRSRPDLRRIGFDGTALPVTQPLDPGRHVWLIAYTNEIPPNVMIQRGHWIVGRQKIFRNILIFELFDPPSPSATTQESTRDKRL
ncbi:MAG TPA: glycosyltransferase family 39 protein [Tepidisphaeraceae bacterium]